MSKAIQCDRCGKTESIGMSETFDGPFHEVLQPGHYADLLRRLDERTAQTPCACVNGNCRMHLLGPATYCDGHRSLDDALLCEARAELERLYGITR